MKFAFWANFGFSLLNLSFYLAAGTVLNLFCSGFTAGFAVVALLALWDSRSANTPS
jgi:hypothetical protein